MGTEVPVDRRTIKGRRIEDPESEVASQGTSPEKDVKE